MKSIGWRYALPIVNGLLAVVLLDVGSGQQARYLTDKMSAWDYIPPARQVAYMVNFPAFVASSAIRHLVPDATVAENAGFLVSTCGLWYFVGLWADRRRTSLRERSSFGASVVVHVCGIVGSAAIGIFAFVNLMLHPLLGFSGFMWCGFLLWSLLGRKASG